eukprot:6192169-Pleurochrysis_carterae.AAC.3
MPIYVNPLSLDANSSICSLYAYVASEIRCVSRRFGSRMKQDTIERADRHRQQDGCMHTGKAQLQV